MRRMIDADALAAQVIADSMDEAILKGLHNVNTKKYSRFLALIATAPSITCKECHHMAITAVREPEVGKTEPVGFLCRRWKRPTIPEGFCHQFIPKNQENDDAARKV